jgi:hypothetical protein
MSSRATSRLHEHGSRTSSTGNSKGERRWGAKARLAYGCVRGRAEGARQGPRLGAAVAMEGEVQEWSAATRIRRRHREASGAGSWSLATRRARAMANREEQRKERLGWEELGACHGKAPGRGAPWQWEEDAREREESRARRVRREVDARGREKQGGSVARKKHGVRELKKRMSSSAGKYQRSRRLKKNPGTRGGGRIGTAEEKIREDIFISFFFIFSLSQKRLPKYHGSKIKIRKNQIKLGYNT